MGFIKKLSEDLVRKIAAGEVIERPASVVKELVENSIDARATRIEIEIGSNGKNIKVSDNGNGIDAGDIPLLFERYATSKIKTFEDLWEIETLGFRGEALASISAVSKIKCLSKHKNNEHGFELVFVDGKVNKKTAAISQGTIIEVSDLFFNVPARQKFLKSTKTELGHICDVITSEALSHPEISFKLFSSGKIILETTGSGDLQQVICELLGEDLRDNVIKVSSSNQFLSINGYLSSLEVYRRDRKSVFIFINKRPVKCQILSKAIISAYEGLLPSGNFPIVVLDLKFKPKFVDVNVHPTKKEVRYSSPNEVYNFVLGTLQGFISSHYKKKYEEKSVYNFPDGRGTPRRAPTQGDFGSYKQNQIQTELYSKAAFDLYRDVESKPEATESFAVVTSSSLFSVSNLKCKIVYSSHPIANMTKAGNKVLFETGLIFEKDLQVVFSGEIVGDDSYNKQFFNFLAELGQGIYECYLKKREGIEIQKTVASGEYNEEEAIKKEGRKKPPEKLLYEVWERDFWTCVYCGKKLLDPKLIKKAIGCSENSFIDYINKQGDKVTVHVLEDHLASYDHYYPASKLPQFNFERDNLFACCLECNREKSDSMDVRSWCPNRQNNWDKPLEIAGLVFKSPEEFYVVQKSTSL